jgi:dihydroorotate dehydrogenase electron transfer subunit
MIIAVPGIFSQDVNRTADKHGDGVLSSSGLRDGQACKLPIAGQFVGLYLSDGAHLLPRPIRICEVLPERAALRLVYKVVGKGTEQFSRWQPGQAVNVLGPLGNGFTPIAEAYKSVVVGGGVGIPPMLELAKPLAGQGKRVIAVLGFADETFLVDEFKRVCEDVYIATDSGREGVKGNVTDVLKGLDLLRGTEGNTPCGSGSLSAVEIKNAALYACGPKPMLRAVKAFAEERGLPLQVSMEERMACGVGACLCCAVEGGYGQCGCEASHKPRYLRVCKDGPVFDAWEVAI